MSYSSISRERKWNARVSPPSPPKTRLLFFRSRKSVLLAVGAVLAVVAAIVCLRSDFAESKAGDVAKQKHARRILRSDGSQSKKKMGPREAVREAMKSMPRKKRVPKTGFVRPTMVLSMFSGKDLKLAEGVQEALDANDCASTLEAAMLAMESANPELRRNAVEAMGWFGEDALPELTAAMADADEDVADSAEHAWEMAVNGIDEAGNRFAIAAAALGTLSEKDKLSSISGLMTLAASEMIDGEDDDAVADRNRIDVVQTLVDIMDAGGKNSVAQAQEAYSDVTGEEWTDIDAAERWLVENQKTQKSGGENEQENGGVDAGGDAVE